MGTIHRGRRRVRALTVAGLLAVLGACGEAPPETPEARGVARIGSGPAHQPGSLSGAVRAARPVVGLACRAGRRRALTAHVELFGRGEVIIVPAGIGVAPPRERDGAYVRGGRCRYPLWTAEPTGLVDMARPGLTLGDLFAVWGRPLSRHRLASFREPVRAWVAGREWRGALAAIPLGEHAQVVVQAGPPWVEPHARYVFPPGR